MKGKTLIERINATRAEAEAYIDDRAAALAAESPGVPIGVLRNLIAARAPGCACQQALGEAAAEK